MTNEPERPDWDRSQWAPEGDAAPSTAADDATWDRHQMATDDLGEGLATDTAATDATEMRESVRDGSHHDDAERDHAEHDHADHDHDHDHDHDDSHAHADRPRDPGVADDAGPLSGRGKADGQSHWDRVDEG
jgi:hypothetical protein